MSTIDTTVKNNYLFTCARLPETQFKVIACALPTVSLGSAIYPGRQADISIPGNKIEFDPMIVEFLIDENFDNYKEIFDWMLACRYSSEASLDEVFADGELTILSNNKQVIRKIRFEGIWPEILTEVSFVTADDTAPQMASLTLRYTQFVFVD